MYGFGFKEDLTRVITERDKLIERLRTELRCKTFQIKEIQAKLSKWEKNSKKSNIQFREKIEDLQDENRKLKRFRGLQTLNMNNPNITIVMSI